MGRILTTIVLALALLATPATATTRHEIAGGTEAQQAIVEWALGRYGEAGLDLPGLKIVIYDDERGCGGHKGLFHAVEMAIDLCTDSPFYALHEIAHAWEHTAMTDTGRDAFMAELGAEVWNDADQAWRTRPVEIVANTIAWGLLDDPLSDGEARLAAEQLGRYHSITGDWPLRCSETVAEAVVSDTGAAG